MDHDDDTPVLPLHLVESDVVAICTAHGHCFEGHKIGARLVGRCQRCGIGILTDGS